MAWSKLMNNFLCNNGYISVFACSDVKVMIDSWNRKQSPCSSSDLKTQNFSQSRDNKSDNNELRVSCRKEIRKNRDESLTFFRWKRGKKIISMKTYFYVCLFEWKFWQSSTNNKLWWFQNDSTDFSRLLLFRWDHALNEWGENQNKPFSWKIFATKK